MSEIKKLWHFRQNNSGGFYAGPAYHIIVEADNEREAWEEAQKLGASNEGSCSCCGDRWYSEPDEIKSRDHVIYVDMAIEDQNYRGGDMPLILGCPGGRKCEFRVSMEFGNFAKNA